MTVSYAHNGSVDIAYETIGPPDGAPLLLIMGTGGQMLSWPDGFCQELVDRGFRVARFDNRDVGLSTHMTGARPPGQLTMLLRPGAGAAYSLADMADDALAVMDDLQWPSADLVGVSQGGMIAQAFATRHPSRIRTLTSISSTPAAKIAKPRGRTMARIVKAANPKKVRTSEDLADYMIGLSRVVGSPAYPEDPAELRSLAARCYERGGGLKFESVQRQTAAIVAAGDRRSAIAGISAPTLVIHGEDDPLIRPEGGRETAEAIPGARLVTYPGMGHDLPRPLWAGIADEIATLADRK